MTFYSKLLLVAGFACSSFVMSMPSEEVVAKLKETSCAGRGDIEILADVKGAWSRSPYCVCVKNET